MESRAIHCTINKQVYCVTLNEATWKGVFNKHPFKGTIGSFYYCLSNGAVRYTSNMLYMTICKEMPHLIGYIFGNIISVDVCRYPHNCHYSNKCVIAQLDSSELKAGARPLVVLFYGLLFRSE